MIDQVEQPEELQDSGAANQSQAGQENADDLDLEGGEQNEDAQNEEDEEIEIAGRKLAMPKSVVEELKKERMLQADYTRKTQEVAEQRKAVETEQQQVRQSAKEQQQFIQDYAKVVAIDDQLAQYAALNWQQLIAEDPVLAMQYQQQQRQLEGQRAQAAQAVTQKQEQEALNKQQGIAKQIQDAKTYFEREVPGWSEERNLALQKYAQGQGIDGQALGKALLRSPSIIKLLHKAEMFDRMEQKRTEKPKPTAPPAPVTRVSAAKQTAKSPEDMTMDEFAAWHNKQQRRK